MAQVNRIHQGNRQVHLENPGKADELDASPPKAHRIQTPQHLLPISPSRSRVDFRQKEGGGSLDSNGGRER